MDRVVTAARLWKQKQDEYAVHFKEGTMPPDWLDVMREKNIILENAVAALDEAERDGRDAGRNERKMC